MRTRTLGRTGLTVAVLGFGCGGVGGLMVRGDPADQERTVARAVELGVNYFDTAPGYGDGESERNIGRILAKLKPNVFLGTKIRLAPDEKTDIARAIRGGMEASLRRLGRDSVDLFQLHNPITHDGAGGTLTARMVLDQVVPEFEMLRRQGKTRFIGITAIGDADALHAVIDSASFDTAQVAYNMLNLNPLAARLHASGMGTIGIRVLAAGALSGEATRHPIASPPPEPIDSGPDYAADLVRAQRFRPLIEAAGATTLAEVAVRFAIGDAAMSTTLIGIATPEQFEIAAAAAAKGPLPDSVLAQLRGIQNGMRG